MRKLFNLGIGASLLSFSICANEQVSIPQAPPRLPTDVFLASPDYTFTAYFNALIMQPTTSNLSFATDSAVLPAPAFPAYSFSPEWNVYEIHTDYQFGFDVGVGYLFHKANSELTLSWEHFHSHDSDSEPSFADSFVYVPLFGLDIAESQTYQEVKGKNKFWFDEINLDYQTFVNFGDHLKLNFISGVSFARIKQTLSSYFNTLDGNKFLKITTPSTFAGAGPQFGLSFSQNILKGFNFNGKIAGAFLVGTQKNNTNFSTPNIPIGLVGQIQKLNPENKLQVVPGLEGNLGLAYLFSFCKHYMINLEAGYKAQIYFNPIQTSEVGLGVIAPSVISIGLNGVSPNSLSQSLSNFALAGPYVMLNVGF